MEEEVKDDNNNNKVNKYDKVDKDDEDNKKEEEDKKEEQDEEFFLQKFLKWPNKYTSLPNLVKLGQWEQVSP